ncbi:MAG: hypothetical protein ACLQVN_19995 [Bryobacteraceae bacterium]
MLPILAVLSPAIAAPITYTLTGYVQVTANGNQVSTSFTWTVNADTVGITNPSVGHFQNPATSNSITFTGSGTTPITGVIVSLNTTTGQITFGNTSGGIGLTNSQLQKWDLASPIGPLSGPNVLVSGTITTDTGTVITLTGVANVNNGPSPTFQASQAPTITNVTNAASYIQPGLPNSGIAQGSVFTVFGSNLGPSSLAIASAAFQSTSLSNTSVAVTVNGTKVDALMYYTSTGQVAALLPSNTPTGSGTITVTYNGQTSASYPITVVSSNAGIFTVGSNGQGAAVVTDADYSLVSPAKAANCGGPNTTCGAANSGDPLILWATGLGPVSGSDAAGAGLGQNMSSLPLTVWLGGVQAPVAYQGRSGCCIGEDQIVFTVPNNVPTGCAVPLLIQIGSLISNVTVLPVASGSRTCPPTSPALASAGVTNFQSTVNTGPVVVGSIAMTRDPLPVGQTGYTDNIKFQFTKVLSVSAGYTPFLSSYLDEPALGSCLVYNSLKISSNYGLSGATTGADAGASFTVTGPNGSKTLTGNAGQFSAVLSSTGAFLSPGAYTVTGTGGADVGAFNAALTIPAAPTLVSPSIQAAPPSVTRSSGLAFTWSGGVSNAYVQLQVTGPTDSTFSNGAIAVCNVAASAGTFTIPSYVMLALPASNFASFQVQQFAEAAVTAQGMPYATISSGNVPAGIGNFTLK